MLTLIKEEGNESCKKRRDKLSTLFGRKKP